jgi:hypothetical protein
VNYYWYNHAYPLRTLMAGYRIFGDDATWKQPPPSSIAW